MSDSFAPMAFDGFFANDMALAPPPLMGDFYREPDDVCRGLTLDLEDAFHNSVGAWRSDFQDVWAFDACSKLGNAPSLLETALEKGLRFQDSQEPRRVPEDPLFYFEKTHCLLGVSSAKAGNRVLDFLEQEIHASITKVNEKKFSIKAEAFIDGRACQIKVNIYQQDVGCVVEFQRRSGDGCAFKQIYEKANQYLSDKLSEQHRHHALAPTHHQYIAGHAVEKSLSACLQMARQSECLRGEMIGSMLAAIEEDPQALPSLCNVEMLEVLVDALRDDKFPTAFPAARLLALAASTREAQPNFLAQGLLNSLISRLWVHSSGREVWLQLAHVVHQVISDRVMDLSFAQRKELAGTLANAIALEPSEVGACVSRLLQEALQILRDDFSGQLS